MESRRQKRESFDLLYQQAIEAINNDDLNKLDTLLYGLYKNYDWENKWDSDDTYIYEFMRLAGRNNNKNLAIYLMETDPYKEPTDNSEKKYYPKDLLEILFYEAAMLGNYELCKFVLDYATANNVNLAFYSVTVNATLKGKNKYIIDLVFNSDKLSLTDHWCDSAEAINYTLKLAQEAFFIN